MLGLDPVLMRFLDGLFGKEAVLYTSLTFEYGTEQKAHRDAPYFETVPFGQYFGVWTALEDVSLDAGALEVIEGGHRIPGIDHKAEARRLGKAPQDARIEDYDALLDRVFDQMQVACDAAGLPRRRIVVRKGEKIIWHPWLPPGGSQVLNPALTRRSIAGHYIPRAVPVFGVDVFFGFKAPDPTLAYGYGQVGRRAYVVHGAARFADSYI